MTGQIIERASNNTPSGFLPCDGAAVSRSTYSTLFSEIGSAYGNGDGSTTFNVPDLRGRSPLGAGTGSGLSSRSLGDINGSETKTLTTTELPSHSHSINAYNGGATTKLCSGNYLADGGSNQTNTYRSTAPTTTLGSSSISNTGTGSAFDIMNPFAVVAYYIEF